MGTRHAIALGGALLAAACAVPAASGAQRVLFSSGNLRKTYEHVYRPTYVLFGQRSTISGLRWQDWNSSRPHANGTLEFNDCQPNCSSGHLSHYRVAVTLSRVRMCDGRPHYLTMHFRYRGARPAGLLPTYRENFGRLC